MELPLEPIAEFHKGPGTRVGWPWLYLEAGATTFSRDSDRTLRSHQVRITLALDTGQYDQEMAQEDAHDYARMLDMVITSAGPWPSLGDCRRPRYPSSMRRWEAAPPRRMRQGPSTTCSWNRTFQAR